MGRSKKSAESAPKVDQVIAAMKAEIELARAEGWRVPRKSNICRTLGVRPDYFTRKPMDEVILAEFADSLEQQRRDILAEAKVMAKAFSAGAIEAGQLTLAELERRLGMKITMLIGSAVDPAHRFHKVRQQCLQLWEKVNPVDTTKTTKLDAVVPVDAAPKRQMCRCCNTSVEGKKTINGYLLECWIEYRRAVAIDEGKMHRLSA